MSFAKRKNSDQNSINAKHPRLDEGSVLLQSSNLNAVQDVVDESTSLNHPRTESSKKSSSSLNAPVSLNLSPESDCNVALSDSRNTLPKDKKVTAKYLNGEVRLTYSKYATSAQNSKHIKFTDILEKEGLRNAILSSYVWEDDWVFNFIPKNLNVILLRNDIMAKKLGTCQIINPKISGYGCMHVKILILNYGSFLRVAIPSANLYEFDWIGIQNVVFVQDFLYSSTPSNSSGFLKQLETILFDLGLTSEHTSFLHFFDDHLFQGHLVFSKPGTSQSYGLSQLASFAEKKLGFSSDDILDIEITTSSLGSMNEKYLHQFLEHILGKLDPQQFRRNVIKIGFPTMDTVLNSHDSHISSQSIFLHESNLEQLSKCYLARLESKVEGGLLHAKTILACRKFKLEDKRPLGFYYAGSHNFTKAAWGWLTSTGKLTIRNYELGVVFPIKSASEIDSIYPISYKRPMSFYCPGIDIPWHNS